MLSYQVILPHVLPFAAVFARLAGLFIFAPALASIAIPARVKVLLLLASTAVVYPTLDLASTIPFNITLFELVSLVFTETLIGFCIGYIAMLPVLAGQMGGLIMGQQMGLSIASVFNPALDSDGDIIGQILLFTALAIFLSIDGLERMHFSLVQTFATVPIGAFSHQFTPLDLASRVSSAGFEIAVRVAAPVTAIMALEMVLTGFLMKTVPQLNVLSFGFPLRIMAGSAVLIASFYIMIETIASGTDDTMMALFDWTSAPTEFTTFGGVGDGG